MEAVLFAMCFAAVASMADSECIIHLGGSRETILPEYKRNVEKALAGAGLLNRSDIATLQALTIYVVRGYPPFLAELTFHETLNSSDFIVLTRCFSSLSEPTTKVHLRGRLPV